MSRRIAFAVALLLLLRGTTVVAQERRDGYLLIRRALAGMDLSNADNLRSDLSDAAKVLRDRNDAFGQWLALANLAWVESALGRRDAAIVQTQKAFAVIQESKRSKAPFNVTTVVAFATDLKMSRTAIRRIESRPEELKPVLLDQYLVPFTLDLHGSLLTETGQLATAEEELSRARVAAKPLRGRYDYSIESLRRSPLPAAAL